MDQQLSEALELHRKGEAAQALKLYEHVLKRDRPPLVAFLNASSIWRSEEKTELSIGCLKRGIEFYPNEAGLWNNLANCHLDTQALTIAISHYRQALTLNPGFIEARVTLVMSSRPWFCTPCIWNNTSPLLQNQSDKERQRLLFPLVEVTVALAAQDNKKFELNDLEHFMQFVENEVTKNMAC